MAKMWGGRFEQNSSKLLEIFNASIGFDQRLWTQDIAGSQAHAKMLNKIGILDSEELDAILGGLQQIASEIENKEFEFKIEHEDIHMSIESRLTELIGDAGKKLHTARSRNDQVATDFTLFVLQQTKEIRLQILELMSQILKIAKNHTHTIMPGFTHLQHAQPVSFGFHLCAWACSFMRDVLRLESDFERNNFCPLGSGALAGTPYNNDREFVAKELGFSAPSINAMDSVSNRDFALDLLYSLSMCAMHISRIAEELVLWSSSEFGFITLSDAYSTGSSIMPQKKNPDVPELLRGKSGRVFGNLFALLSVMKALPLAYNKDTQEDKEGVFDSLDTLKISIEILTQCLKTMSVNSENLKIAALKGHLSATDLADFLVKVCGVPFRESHHITGRVVALAEKQGVDISQLDEEQILSVDSRIQKGVKAVLNIESSMQARNSLGGTASERVQQQIEQLEKFVKDRI